jgi:hypothetical protein
MAEIIESVKETDSKKDLLDTEAARNALLRLRQLAANLPPIDAAAVIRDIRESGSKSN